ncbi:MAG TPA: carboxylesterase/lipase family protein [Acidimicrobiales bacterium]|nr:carboxylesterase/lipase family protein [Acidimicrobiales bacterium]
MDGTVVVDGGWVRGHEEDAVWAFLGVPYARAPVGPLRWRPPQRPEPWSGVRVASAPGPLAPQPVSAGSTLPGDPFEQSEDCLHLSIWTPAPDTSRRPVLVWVHGGGFTSGTAGSILYRGRRLAADGDVVVVDVNYRLGALGFLAHRALGDGAHGGRVAGNWALLDQIAALRWVREHVGSFGGDPSNVTLFGESAGAMCVSALLAAPAARGLFRAAAIQSGPPYTHAAGRAEEVARAFTDELGVSEASREALESVPARALVDALTSLSRRGPRPGELPQPLIPVVDGLVLPEPPLEAIARGSAAGVATIVGTNRDEMTFFSVNDPSMHAADEEWLAHHVEQSAPRAPVGEVVGHYREVLGRRGEPSGPRELWTALGSDAVFRWPSLRMAAALRAHEPRTYVYLFTWESPAFGGVLGATHALEIPFVFGTHDDPAIARFVGSGPRADELSAAMRASWVSLARGGDPSNALVGTWPSWERERRATMVFGPTVCLEHQPRNDELFVWEAVDPMPGGLAVGLPRGS